MYFNNVLNVKFEDADNLGAYSYAPASVVAFLEVRDHVSNAY